MAGMLDGAIHPIRPNPITLKSLRSQFLSKQLNLPPSPPATLSGFLAVTPDFKNPEVRESVLVEEILEGEEREDAPRPTTALNLQRYS